MISQPGLLMLTLPSVSVYVTLEWRSQMTKDSGWEFEHNTIIITVCHESLHLN